MAGVDCVVLAALLLHVSTGQQVVVQSIRLANGNLTAGRVEVQIANQWGTVCDDEWDDLDATVACRSLNLTGGRAFPLARYGAGTGPILMDNIFCQGNERSLGQCGFVTGAGVNCGHNEDASVQCDPGVAGQTTLSPTTTLRPGTNLPSNCATGPTTQANVQLYGQLKGIGYVQVKASNGTFGFVCDDGWDVNAAKVVCRELCYTDMSVVSSSMKAEYSAAIPNPVIAVDDLNCVGNEDSLVNCSHSPWWVHNCASTELAKVTCVDVTYQTPPLPHPELQCRNGDLIALFNTSRDPNMEPKHLTIADNYTGSCTFVPAFTADRRFIEAKINFEQCGTRVKQNATHLIYTNAIKLESTSRQGDITRINEYRVELTCEMPRDGSVTQVVQPLTETVTQKTVGQFVIQMRIYMNKTFTQEVPRYPFQLTLGDWLNAAVDLESVDSRLKLVVTDCVAKASATDLAAPVYPLYQNKCVTEQTLEVHPISNFKFGLRFQPFIFVNYPNVVLECAALVCLQTEVSEECDRSCNNAKPTPAPTPAPTGRRRRSVEARPVYRVHTQPVHIIVQQMPENPSTNMPLTTPLPMTTVTTTTTSTQSTTTTSTTPERTGSTTRTILVSSTTISTTQQPTTTTPSPPSTISASTSSPPKAPTPTKLEESLGAGGASAQGSQTDMQSQAGQELLVRSAAADQGPTLLVSLMVGLFYCVWTVMTH